MHHATSIDSRPRAVRSDGNDSTAGGLFASSWRMCTLGILALTSLLAFEALAVATAMPAAAAELGGVGRYAFAFAGALAGSVAGIVAAGRWTDARGAAAPFSAAMISLLSGLLAAGLAPTMSALIAGRVLQGVGIGAMGVTLYVVAARAYPARLHAQVFAAMSAAWVVPSLVGPALSALIVDTIGWRWVFLLVPLAAVPAAIAIVPSLRTLAAAGRPAGSSSREIGWATLAAAALCVMHLTSTTREPLALLTATAALAMLAVGTRALLPAGTFRLRPGLASVVAVRSLCAAAFFSAEAYVPLMLIEHQGFSTLAAGATLSAGAIGWFAGAWYRSRPDTRGTPPEHLRTGSSFLLSGTAMIAAVVAGWLPGALTPAGWLAMGAGMGLQRPTLALLLIQLSPTARIGRNSSAFQLGDAIAIAAALAVAGGLFAWNWESRPRQALLLVFSFSVALLVAGRWAIGRIGPPPAPAAATPQ